MTAPDCIRCGQPASAHPPQPEPGNGVARPPLLATRVMKARAQSACGLCTSIIRIGAQIGRLPGYGWCHTSCIATAQHDHGGQDGEQ
jgi:hypothetical protein